MNNTYEVKHRTVEEHNKYVDKSNVQTVITFRTQQLLDLWLNEFEGQISDGEWENCRKTDWLWNNKVWLQLGDKTKVEVRYNWMIGRKRFGMVQELWDAVGNRIIGENGFVDEKEAKKAWREIAVAIYEAVVSDECIKLIDELKAEASKADAEQKAEMLDEFKSVCDSIDEFGRGKVGEYITVRMNTQPKRFSVSVDSYRVPMHNKMSHSVECGHLKSYIEKCQNFIKAYNKLESEFSESIKEHLYKTK